MSSNFYWFDLFGVTVFAISGALVASRKQLDIVGFALLATVTGIGGGTLRDLVLDRPISWLEAPEYLGVCLIGATATYFLAPIMQRRYIVLLWLDSAGMALFSVLGTSIALAAGIHPVVSVAMGVMTATFGGIIRDVIGNELPLVLRKELYVTCAAAGATAFLLCHKIGVPYFYAQLTGFLLHSGCEHLVWLSAYRYLYTKTDRVGITQTGIAGPIEISHSIQSSINSTLPGCFKQKHPRSYRYIEAGNSATHGNPGQVVTVLHGQPA